MPKSFRTGDQALIRELNRSILLNLLRIHFPQSRADLAAATGLNKATVSSLIADLLAAGLVREIGQASSDGGRPAVLFELNPDAGRIIGAELGVGFIKIILADFRATTLWRDHVYFNLSDTPEHVLRMLIKLVRTAANVAERSGHKVFGVGIGVHGLVDLHTGALLYGPHLGWQDVPVRARLAEAFAFPIFVDNDSKVSSIGERYYGVAQHIDNFVYVDVNVGLGVGIWLGGQVHRGATGYAGEVGHTTIVPDGPVCRCGNRGCWEMYAGQRALIERLRAAVAGGSRTCLPVNNGQLADVSLPMIVDAAQAGDALVLRTLDEIGSYLGLGIANLINTFNPSVVVIGGVLSLAADFLMPAIERTVAERAMRWPREAARILVAAHRYDSCVIGSVALVLNDILSHPRLSPIVSIGDPVHGRPSKRKRDPKEVRPDNPIVLIAQPA